MKCVVMLAFMYKTCKVILDIMYKIYGYNMVILNLMQKMYSYIKFYVQNVWLYNI